MGSMDWTRGRMVNGGMVNGGMVDGGMMDWGVDGAVTMAASTRVGVDEGHEGQHCRCVLKHGMPGLRAFKSGYRTRFLNHV